MAKNYFRLAVFVVFSLFFFFTEAHADGSITITKTSVGGIGSFVFTIASPPTTPTSTTITTTVPNTPVVSSLFIVPSGSYTVTETAGPGWQTTGSPCNVTITDGGTTANCNIVNTRIPNITSISPASVTAGSGDTVLTANGTGFGADYRIWLPDISFPTTINAAGTQATTTIPARHLTTARTIQVTVASPSRVLVSNPVTFTIVTAPLPKPDGGKASIEDKTLNLTARILDLQQQLIEKIQIEIIQIETTQKEDTFSFEAQRL